METGRIHQHPDVLLEDARKSATARFVMLTAEWVKQEYPGSADKLIPELRKIYRQKKAEEEKRNRIQY